MIIFSITVKYANQDGCNNAPKWLYYYSQTDFIENDIIVDDDDDDDARENKDDSETPADTLSSSIHTGTL